MSFFLWIRPIECVDLVDRFLRGVLSRVCFVSDVYGAIFMSCVCRATGAPGGEGGVGKALRRETRPAAVSGRPADVPAVREVEVVSLLIFEEGSPPCPSCFSGWFLLEVLGDGFEEPTPE